MYKREDLEKISIYDLRYIGREVGLKSVTTLKKGELINQILLVENDKILPIKSRVGRPYIERVISISDNIQLENKDIEKKIEKLIDDFKKDLLSLIK